MTESMSPDQRIYKFIDALCDAHSTYFDQKLNTFERKYRCNAKVPKKRTMIRSELRQNLLQIKGVFDVALPINGEKLVIVIQIAPYYALKEQNVWEGYWYYVHPHGEFLTKEIKHDVLRYLAEWMPFDHDTLLNDVQFTTIGVSHLHER